jgi:prepilin-type N-terminal cleavage/methylation domain-containing protein
MTYNSENGEKKRGFPDSGFWRSNSRWVTPTMPKLTTGFTLIELMVTVGISSVIMAVVLFNYSSFTDKLALSSAAQEMALSIRQAQTYGLAVKEFSPTSGTFGAGYGIYFASDSDPTHYHVFADHLTVNNKYDLGSGCGGVSTECVEQVAFRDGIRIQSICADECPPFGNPAATALSILFLRPNPDAEINFFTTGGALVSDNPVGSVVLVSPKGNTITVTIQNTGQVEIQ